MKFIEKIREESERTKAGCQVITKHLAICAFISNNASREKIFAYSSICPRKCPARPGASVIRCDISVVFTATTKDSRARSSGHVARTPVRIDGQDIVKFL